MPVCFFAGRPLGSGRSRRPSHVSSLAIKASLPSGRPRLVESRSIEASLSSSGRSNIFRHWAKTISLFHDGISNKSDCFSIPQWTDALLQRHNHALRVKRARTGFRSIYVNARQKCSSPNAHEKNLSCHRWPLRWCIRLIYCAYNWFVRFNALAREFSWCGVTTRWMWFVIKQ